MASETADPGGAMAATAREGLDALKAVRDAFVDADNACDAEAMSRLLADDIVVLHPWCGVIDGKAAVRRFMGDVLREFTPSSTSRRRTRRSA